MKLVDEIYEFYRDRLTGSEEDIDMLTFALLEEMTYEDLLNMIRSLDQQELYNLVGLYILEALKGKFARGRGWPKRRPSLPPTWYPLMMFPGQKTSQGWGISNTYEAL